MGPPYNWTENGGVNPASLGLPNSDLRLPKLALPECSLLGGGVRPPGQPTDHSLPIREKKDPSPPG